MWITFALILAYFLMAALLIYLTHVSSFLRKAGAVVMAYAVGLIAANIGLFPRPTKGFIAEAALQGKSSLPDAALPDLLAAGKISETDLLVNQIASVQENLYSIVILIAIPLLLFSLDLRRWLGLATEALKSMMLALVALFLAIVGGFLLWGDKFEEAYKVGGMLVGVYTGGTANLAAMKITFNVSSETYIMTHTYDVVLGAVFLFFLMTIAQRTFNLFLPHFRDSKKHRAICTIARETEGLDNYIGMLNRRAALKLGMAMLLSVGIVAVSFGLSTLVGENAKMTVLILTLTTLGLLASLNKKINSTEYTFQLGMYFIIVFSLALASIADLRAMLHSLNIYLFLYVAMAIFGSMIIHVMLSKLFRVDTDTTIITITALTYSSPFVPAVAAAIRNKEVIISGLTVGTLGYAIGNYAGLLIGNLLKLM